MSEQNMQRLAVEVLAAKHKVSNENWEWSKMTFDPDGNIYVPECSYLGPTMIALASDYENSGNDCRYVQKACEHAAELAQFAKDICTALGVTDPAEAVERVRELHKERDVLAAALIRHENMADFADLGVDVTNYRDYANLQYAVTEAALRGLEGK